MWQRVLRSRYAWRIFALPPSRLRSRYCLGESCSPLFRLLLLNSLSLMLIYFSIIYLIFI